MRLILTGGGTGGHIMPNIALLEYLKQQGKTWEILYLGSSKGMEKKMMEELELNNDQFQVKFSAIHCGKLRRYFSWENFGDAFKTILGVVESVIKIRRFRPKVIFSKGGYVSFPVVLAGWLCRVPVILHESDVMPGMANKISAKFAKTICVAFEESKKYFKNKDVVVTGNPLRADIKKGERVLGYQISGLKPTWPIILVMGGSSGATFINNLLFEILPEILPEFQIIHISGKDKQTNVDNLFKDQANRKELIKRYCSFEYVGTDLKHLYAITNFIISRAGANSLAEIGALQKPAILIPLSKKASRGDQIVNAKIFQNHHTAIVLDQEETKSQDLLQAIQKLKTLSTENNNISNKFSKASEQSAVIIIAKLILNYENRY